MKKTTAPRRLTIHRESVRQLSQVRGGELYVIVDPPMHFNTFAVCLHDPTPDDRGPVQSLGCDPGPGGISIIPR